MRIHLSGDAANAIAYLKVTADNFVKAIEILQKNYDKPDKMKKARLWAVMDLPVVTKANYYTALRSLYNQANCLIYRLTDPDKDGELNGTIEDLLVEKLPFAMQTKWSKKKRKSTRTLGQLLQFIDDTVSDYEDTALTASLRANNPEVPKFARKVTKPPELKECSEIQEAPSEKIVVPPTAAELLASG